MIKLLYIYRRQIEGDKHNSFGSHQFCCFSAIQIQIKNEERDNGHIIQLALTRNIFFYNFEFLNDYQYFQFRKFLVLELRSTETRERFLHLRYKVEAIQLYKFIHAGLAFIYL